jgi:hypothetical protein
MLLASPGTSLTIGFMIVASSGQILVIFGHDHGVGRA